MQTELLKESRVVEGDQRTPIHFNIADSSLKRRERLEREKGEIPCSGGEEKGDGRQRREKRRINLINNETVPWSEDTIGCT